MRLIHTFTNYDHSQALSAYFTRKQIDHHVEIASDEQSDHQQLLYLLWIEDEDQLEEAQSIFEEFCTDPENSRFATTTPLHSPPPKEINPFLSSLQNKPEPKTYSFSSSSSKKLILPVTNYLLGACLFFFLLIQFTRPMPSNVPIGLPQTPFVTAPMEKNMLYDYPEAYDLLDKITGAYGLDSLLFPATLPQEGKILLEKFYRTPYWQGLYDPLVRYFKGENPSWNLSVPLFEKIGQGEIWRLVTPCLLHADLLHILFNLLWLLLLGKQIESHIGSFRMLLFVILVGAFSNTAQYMMSGLNFVGFSGVICGMVAFIWVRQKKAPWEAYQVHPSTIRFLAFFVLAMTALQLVSFFFEVTRGSTFVPRIANTAHLTGALAGCLLGLFPPLAKER